jgi:hypothetical protein
MKVTLVITTCGRTDLLELTLKSFFKFNTYPIEKTIIIEDSGIPQDFSNIEKIVKTPLEIIVNPKNLGQIKSIDIAYSKVETEYIFHCEEDWEFYSPSFIEKSFEILNDNDKIITVWLRSYNEKKVRPRIDISTRYNLKTSNDHYYLIALHPGKIWQAGFTFNPGLRRTKDAMVFHPYSNQKVHFIKSGLSLIGEMDLMVHYREAGYRAAITSNEDGYMKHIGRHRHVSLPWEQEN